VTPWADIEREAPIRLPKESYETLVAAYASPPRPYHSFDHVIAVVEQWRDIQRRIGWSRPVDPYLALLYHDAIYIAGRSDNEERSAVFAEEQLRGLPGRDIANVARLIRLTAAHGKLHAAEVDRETALFLDCDMAILGADDAVFDRYEAGIAAEYSHLPAALYAAGRRRFIERLLASPRIFLSDDFHQRIEKRARANLQRSLYC
jgi:predicted metal-dependent HD superfamily phosphohydrolase